MQTPEQFIIAELERIVEMYANQIDLLIKENAQLKQRLEKLELKKISRNSSISLSRDENRSTKTNSLQEKSYKRVSGQPGHEGKTLEMKDHPDVIMDHRSGFCPACGKDISNLPFELSCRRQIIEIPAIKQVVSEHRLYHCQYSCRTLVESDFPLGVNHPASYGPNMGSLIGYLSVRQHLPFKRLQETMLDIFGVTISEGELHCLLNRLAGKGREAYEMIRRAVMNNAVIGTDETGMKVNGKMHWFWTWQNKRAIYVATSSNRGIANINDHTEGISEDAELFHDCWKAHFLTPVGLHQLCMVHLARELNYLEELYKVAWPFRFRLMIYEALELKKRYSPTTYYYPDHARSFLDNELDKLLNEEIDPAQKNL